MPVKIAPSILSADFARLGEEIRAVAAAGADEIHVDVMDGRFVPHITVGPLIVEAAKGCTDLPLDVHLMILEPERYVEDFIKAGADVLIIHLEACRHLDRTLAAIREAGAKAGLSLNPATGLDGLEWIWDKIDRLLVMSVNPGFGGQVFIPAAVSKLARLRDMIEATDHPIELAVDGGVNPTTLGQVVKAGARVVVAGSAVFGTPDYEATMAQFRRIIAQTLAE